VIIDFLR